MPKQISKRFRNFGAAAIVAWATWCADVPSARASSVYKCSGADGSVAFQDRPCLKTLAESVVEIAPAPPPAPSPEYSVVSRTAAAIGAQRSQQKNARAAVEVLSYECRAANGELFYRHGACPSRITAKSAGGSRKRSGADAQTFAVSAQALPRGEVCRRIGRAGSIGRAGRERDESVSTYERNLGRDPCRRF
jgi:hypothetical protein